MLLELFHNLGDASSDSGLVGERLVGGTSPWVPVDAECAGSSSLVGKSGLDIFRKTIGLWVWVLLDLSLVSLEPVRVPASGGSTDWVGFEIGLESHPLSILMVHLAFDEVEVDFSIGHFSLELWRVVVEGLLCWVQWWVLKNEVPVVTDDLFSDWKVLVVGNDICIFTKINNWVIFVVTIILLWVLVLVASGR